MANAVAVAVADLGGGLEAYLRTSRGVILPIGSTEQHGPIGLIGTDAICAEVIARGMGEAAGALVAPTVAVGTAQHHLGFAGSVTLRPTTLIAVLRDIVESLAVHGFERFYFINGHGGNIDTVTAAFVEIYAARSLAAGANVPPVKMPAEKLVAEPGGAAAGERALRRRRGQPCYTERGGGAPVRLPGCD